jgi:hypothetical protein
MENESAVYFYHFHAVKIFGLIRPSLLGPRCHLAYYFGTPLCGRHDPQFPSPSRSELLSFLSSRFSLNPPVASESPCLCHRLLLLFYYSLQCWSFRSFFSFYPRSLWLRTAVLVAQRVAPMPRDTHATLRHASFPNAIALAQARQVD